ncbi:MAG: CHAD domain-containing protein [Planctomycetia bacterium]|nr:CHAD domain-containing protein [Planctomycetia bacterium]
MSRGGVPSAVSIDPERPVSREFRRVLADELNIAIEACDSHGSWEVRRRSEAIRRTRKALKRFRAVLDLVKGAIAADDHESMKIASRDFGRRLSPLRDRDVVLALLDALGEQATGRRRREAVRMTGAVLSAAKALPATRDHREDEAVIDEVRNGLEELAKRVVSVDFDAVDRDSVIGRFDRAWRHVRHRFHDDVDEDDDLSRLHENRKRVIRLQLGLAAIRGVNPGAIRRDIRGLKEVASALGRDRDLSMLEAMVAEHADRFPDPEARRRIEAEIADRRGRLQRDAIRAGRDASRRPPVKFRKRLENWWSPQGG